MSYLDDYRARVKGSVGDGLKNNTIQIINSSFSDSPTYKTVVWDGSNTGVRIVNNEDPLKRTILFNPPFSIQLGHVCEIDGESFLSVEAFNDEVFPKASIKLCNSKFPLPGTTTRTKIGTDSSGRPVYDDVTSPPTLLPCIVETTIYIPNDSQTIQLPNGKILVTIPYTVNDAIAENKEFEMYDETYKIIGIDRSQSVEGVGLMLLHCERVV